MTDMSDLIFELRLGNFVTGPKGPEKVKRLEYLSNSTVLPKMSVRSTVLQLINVVSANSFKGVLITGDRLIAFGFINTNERWLLKNTGIAIIRNGDFSYRFEEGDNPSFGDIHVLQNLWRTTQEFELPAPESLK